LDREVRPALTTARTDWTASSGIDTNDTPTTPRLVTIPAGHTP
jgi:hypothetical protein